MIVYLAQAGIVGSPLDRRHTAHPIHYRVANPNHIPMGTAAHFHVFVNERGQHWDEGDDFVPDADVAPETLEWLIEQGLIEAQAASAEEPVDE